MEVTFSDEESDVEQQGVEGVPDLPDFPKQFASPQNGLSLEKP